MPKLWEETIEAHRREVSGAILDSTATLVAEHGLLSVTMSQVAEETGIGRATLYKYYPDVASILIAWHERQLVGHLDELTQARDRAEEPREGLKAVLETYAFIQHNLRQVHTTELAAHLHNGEHYARAEEHIRGLFRDLLREATETGDVRNDVTPEELAGYCLHALAGASGLSSKAAVRRLIQLTLAGLQPPT